MDEEDANMTDYHQTYHQSNHLTTTSEPGSLYGPQVIDVIKGNPEFSFLIRYYNLLYQSLIPNCKLTIKTLKQHLEIPSDVESFIVNGESSRIRCQRIINLLLVQLDTTRDYKHFCYLFNMISVMTDLPDKLSTGKAHLSRVITTSSVNQLDNYAVDNIIIRCVDDEPPDDRADYFISSHPQVIGRRRCRFVNITTANTSSTRTDKISTSSIVTSDGHRVHTNSTPLSTDVTFSITESMSPPSSTGSGTGNALQSTMLTQVSNDVTLNITESPSSTNGREIGNTVQAIHLVRSKYDDIVQSLPSDYEKTLEVVQDQLTDDQICDVLTSPNYTAANKTILNCLMDKVKCVDDIAEFCDQLDKITSLLPDTEILILLTIVNELRKASLLYEPEIEETHPPRKTISNKDFAQLKTHYHTILQSMPDNYEQSVGMLQNYISDDQICMILSSSNSTTANKIILDCLIERMSCREELLDLCDQLESIATSHQLRMVINEIRSDVQQSVLLPTGATPTTNVQSLSSEQQLHSIPPSMGITLYDQIFSKMKLDPSSRVLPVLKTNFTRLCHCLPQDFEKTIDKLKQLMPEIPAEYLKLLKTFPSTELINEAIVGHLMGPMEADDDVFKFCGIMENLSDEITTKNLINSLRNEFLEALSLSPPTTITTNISLPNNGVSSPPESHNPTTVSSDSSVRVESVSVVSSTSQPPKQANVSSKLELREVLKYEHKRMEKGITCPQPPPLSPKYVRRQQLLDKMVSKLNQSSIEPNSYGTSLTITGAGGFGKTSIVTALCHHPFIKEQFRDGIVFIELGPQATDPSMKLKGLYNLLTDKQCDVNTVEQKITQLTSLYCRNLLVIIDDVWYVKDVEPIVRAFSNCKIVLTTRMNDIEQYIPTKQVVSVGPMEQSEAISLLTCGVIDVSQLSQDDVSLLDELAQDVHLWPLLLSLVRGQLLHNLKQHKSCYHEAIQLAKANLCEKGLTAFDKNNIERSRQYAVKSCIEATLVIISKSLSHNIKSLILFAGIGNSLQRAVLHKLWNSTENEARNIVDVLWSYGLVQFTDITMPPHGNIQNHIEVHAVISQYITEHMDSIEVFTMTPYLGRARQVKKELSKEFLKWYGICDVSSLSVTDYLKYKLIWLEYDMIPSCMQQISLSIVTDPHETILLLRETMTKSQHLATFLPSLSDDIESLISDCRKILNNTYNINRKFTQSVQCYFAQKSYQNLIRAVETFVNTYANGLVAQRGISILQKAIPYCDGELLDLMNRNSEVMQLKTNEYNMISLQILPTFKLLIKEVQQIDAALQAGSPHIEMVYQYLSSTEYDDEISLIKANMQIKQQEVAPNC